MYEPKKKQRGGCFSIPWGTLGASLLGNVILRKGVIPAGNGVIKDGNGLKKERMLKVTSPSQQHNFIALVVITLQKKSKDFSWKKYNKNIKVKAYDLIMCGYFVDTLDLLTSCSKLKPSQTLQIYSCHLIL